MRYIVGIDPGVKTGIAIWDKEKKVFAELTSCSIIKAMAFIRPQIFPGEYEMRIEDARLRKWFGNSGREKLQGVGSVKRDSAIWEEFCKFNGIKHTLVHPKDNMTKLTGVEFKRLTKYDSMTNEHARDAGMLVFGL